MFFLHGGSFLCLFLVDHQSRVEELDGLGIFAVRKDENAGPVVQVEDSSVDVLSLLERISEGKARCGASGIVHHVGRKYLGRHGWMVCCAVV